MNAIGISDIGGLRYVKENSVEEHFQWRFASGGGMGLHCCVALGLLLLVDCYLALYF